MKKRIPSFLAGAATALALTALATSALAASGQVSFNFANVALNGETKIAAGSTVTVANGQQVPSSILYTDAVGGKTNYLPIRAISELLGVEIGYDSSTRTVLLGEQPATETSSETVWEKVVDNGELRYKCDVKDVEYDTLPAWYSSWNGDGWGIASVDASMSGNGWVRWKWQKGTSYIDFTCSYPCSYSMGQGMSAEAALNSQKVSVNGHQAELYQEGSTCILVWEDDDGVLFWLRGLRVDAETLTDFAGSIRPCTAETSSSVTLPLVPKGYARMTRVASGNTAYEVWNGGNLCFTWLCTDGPVAVPSGDSETVAVNGTEARFWAATEEPEHIQSPILVNGTPVEDGEAVIGSVTVTSATIPGLQSKEVSTLVWTDPDSGLSFRLQGALNQETLIRMAEQMAK